MDKLTYPIDCITTMDKVELCHIAQEQLRLEHNEKGSLFARGLISAREWRNYVDYDFNPRSHVINIDLCKHRAQLPGREDVGPIPILGYDKEQFKTSTRWALDLKEIPKIVQILDIVDPIEDFSAYTEVDPGTYIGVTSTTVTVTDIPAIAEKGYVYKDKGAGHFAGDFEHLLQMKMLDASEDQVYVSFWILANEIGDYGEIKATGSKDCLRGGVYSNATPTFTISIREVNNGSSNTDSYTISAETDYWLKIKRVEGSPSMLYMYLYSNSSRTTLVDTMSVELAEDNDFRYVYSFATEDQGGSDTEIASMSVANLDLQEGVAVQRVLLS